MDVVVQKTKSLNGTINIPGDKSISHRSIMFGAIACGTTEIEGFLLGEDCLSTISVFRELGIDIEVSNEKIKVHGKGLYGLQEPKCVLDAGNSGTTIRLLSGLLSAQNFTSSLTGDNSIQKRPMGRVMRPLMDMGALFSDSLFAPFTITGTKLKGITYEMPVASAQVKSAILLASLYADGETKIIEKYPTRNHTEIMLNQMGASIRSENGIIVSSPIEKLSSAKIKVPADISSAAYFIVAACICEDSTLILKNIGLNPTRTGILDALLLMGANIEITNRNTYFGEPVGDICISSSSLKGITIGGLEIPRLIDEIPILAVAACFSMGTTIIKNAEELKVKESNRIHTVVTELKKFGADIEETEDGMIIHGSNKLKSCVVTSYNDHRIAMAMAIAALNATGETTIKGAECVLISFPDFFESLFFLQIH